MRNVRVPRDGEYIAEYVPDRTREPERQTVGVLASQSLRANATLDVTPPPVRVVAAARAGLFYNLGHAAGPAVFVEAMRPMRVGRVPFLLGVTAGYLRGDVTAGGPDARATDAPRDRSGPRHGAGPRARAAGGALRGGGGGRRRRVVRAHQAHRAADRSQLRGARHGARARRSVLGAEIALALRPGRLVIGLRYLWIALGRTSQGDVIDGNSAGLIGDIGYRMTF